MSKQLVHNYWQQTTNILAHLLKHDDPTNFANWHIIQATMLAPGSDENKLKYEYVKDRFSLDLFEESEFGNIPLIPNTQTSYNVVQQLYQLSLLLDVVGDINNCGNILEFGGGYGSMCRLVKRMKHAHDYTIFDLPEFTELQNIFLYYNNIRNYTTVHEYNSLADQYDTLISMFAICETPHALRQMIFDKTYKYIFISFANNFEDMDNRTYFEHMLPSYSDRYDWTIINNPMHPIAYYVIGVRKNLC